MVRMRCRIAEDEGHDSARAKLREALEEHLSDPEEQAFVEPRLAQLLGLAEATAPTDRTCSRPGGCSSSASRRSTRRCSRSRTCSGPTRACSTSSSTCSTGRGTIPLYVITLARPELVERRPTLGRGRSATSRASISTRCPEESMGELLDGLVPGLPSACTADPRPRGGRAALRGRDRPDAARPGRPRAGRLGLHPTGEIVSLDVPETLHALIAARLDGLTPDERRLLQDARRAREDVHGARLAALGGVEGQRRSAQS